MREQLTYDVDVHFWLRYRGTVSVMARSPAHAKRIVRAQGRDVEVYEWQDDKAGPVVCDVAVPQQQRQRSRR